MKRKNATPKLTNTPKSSPEARAIIEAAFKKQGMTYRKVAEILGEKNHAYIIWMRKGTCADTPNMKRVIARAHRLGVSAVTRTTPRRPILSETEIEALLQRVDELSALIRVFMGSKA